MMDSWYPDACKTWNRVLDRSVAEHADKVMFVCGSQSITFSQFHARVKDFAKGLLYLGINKGDIVAIWMTNSIEWAVCQFAVYRTGAMLLPLYSYYRKSELEYALNQSGIHALITSDTFLRKIDALGILKDTIPGVADQRREKFDLARFPALESVIVVNETPDLSWRYGYSELMELGRQHISDTALLERDISISPFDVMNIMYTSGTTGFPKGGMSMHITNLTTVSLWSQLAQLTADDVILCHVPMFTNFGGLYGVGLGIRNGCKTIITEQFDAGLSLGLIEKERVTYIPGTPSMFRMLLDHDDVGRRDLSSLRGGHVAGAPLNDVTMRGILEVLGARDVMQAWGLSECGGLSTVSTREHPLDRRLQSVGKPLPSVRIRIVDTQTQEAVASGECGEIWLGDVHPGSCVGQGYFGMPDKTQSSITRGGWFRTGDVGFFDSDGFLYIAGRIDDMFTVGGFNVYPAEIEGKLASLNGVREAFVVPIPDHRLGSVPVAWVSLVDGAPLTAEQIVDWCKTQMTVQKAPRRVFFYRPGDLPMTPVGKVRKKELAQKTAALAAQEAAQTEANRS